MTTKTHRVKVNIVDKDAFKHLKYKIKFPPLVKEEFEPFDSTNPKHLKGFEKTIKKISKMVKKYEGPSYFLIDKKHYKTVKKVAKKNGFTFTFTLPKPKRK